MAKRDLIEQRVLSRQYESQKSARTAVTRSHLHGRVKKRLHAIIDTWDAAPPDPNAMPIGPPRPPPVKRGPTHTNQHDPIDRIAMLILIYAAKNSCSMDEAHDRVKQRLQSIAIDG